MFLETMVSVNESKCNENFIDLQHFGFYKEKVWYLESWISEKHL